MRSFLQKKAGATYFADSEVTASIRKHNLELIFALKGGWHAVVSMIPTPEGVILMACLGNFLEQLDKILPSLKLKSGEHSKFLEILEGESGFGVMRMDLDGKGMESGIGKRFEGMQKQHLQLLGDPEIQKAASQLFNQTLSLYFELDKSTYPALKALTECFYDK